MTVHTFRHHTPRPSVQSEEERAWVSFYQRARHHPAIAAEVLAQLDLDPEMKRAHLALYLCCRESLRLHEARAARDQRIGRGVRWLADALTVRALGALRRIVGRTGDVAVACLPGSELAQTQVRRLAADPAIRSARARFRRQDAGPVAAATTPSPGAADAPSAPAAAPPTVRVARGA